MDDGFFLRSFGRGNDVILPDLLKREMAPGEIEKMADEKEEMFRLEIRGKIKAFPGVVELIKSLHEEGFVLAVGSSAVRDNVMTVAEGIGAAEYFNEIVTGDDVENAKPAPDIFLKCSEKCKVPPSESWVIEDSVFGIDAAASAGMRSVAVTNTRPASEFSKADIVVDTLEKLSASDFLK
ncbi:MAG: HAD family hydrolase, partial [Fibrobacterota bacterium]